MTPKLIDSHAHLNFNTYKDDGPGVIRRALDNKIWMINVGSQYDTSKRAAEITHDYDHGVYAAIGLHPIHLSSAEVDEEEIKFKSREEKFDEVKYQALIDNDKHHKIVAVGEIGLDYFHLTENIKALKHKSIKTIDDAKAAQKEEFIKQLKFANKNNLPIILHCRGSAQNSLDAYYDLLEIIKLQITDYHPLGDPPSSRENHPRHELADGLRITGVVHCYGANFEIAQEFINLGFYIGFTGIITFGKNAEDLRQVARKLPLEKILVETDCPYLAPEPHRGERNEPAFVQFTARKIAEIKGVSFEKVAQISTQNTRELFKI